MCDPVTLAIAAGTALLAGTAAQQIGQQRAQEAQRSAYALHASRQDDLASQSRQIFQNSVKQAAPETVQENTAKAEQERKDSYREAVGETPVAIPMQATVGKAPRILNNAVRAEGTERAGFVDGLADALARLNAHGDAMQTLGIELNKNRLSQGVYSDASRGWANNVLPFEVAAAREKGAGARMLGDLLVGAGQIGLGAAGGIPLPSGNPLTGAGKSMTGLSIPGRGGI